MSMIPKIPAHLRTRLVSHAERVCRLYKAMLRDVMSKETDFFEQRYQMVLLRSEFDKRKSEQDFVKAKQWLEEAEEKFEKQKAFSLMQYPTSPGGVAYDREYYFPDWLLDTWHPLEKAQYPHYFARREQRKREFMQRWVAQHGAPHGEHYGPLLRELGSAAADHGSHSHGHQSTPSHGHEGDATKHKH